MSKTISVVIPVFNEEENIPLVLGELSIVMDKLAHNRGYKYEIIFVDDGSTDGTLNVIKKFAVQSAGRTLNGAQISFIEFSRNFGKEMATTAGLNYAKGDCAVIIDADLQHPVEMIPAFIAEWEKGFEVVVGVRRACMSDGWIKVFGSKLFYKIMARISHTDIIPNSTDFCLVDRKVINVFNQCTERTRITRGLIAWLGFKKSTVEFDAKERAKGKASYNHIKLFKLALSSFVSMSLFPLKVAGYLGILITVISGLLGVFVFADKFIFGNNFGFTWLAGMTVMVLFLNGIILSCLGLIALYVGSISGEVSNRPMYVVRESNCK